MKKKLPYIILISLILIFCITCLVGIILFGMQSFTEEFKNNMNQPVPLIGISFGTALLFFFVVFSKTTMGKKSLDTLKNGIEIARDETQKAKDTLVETKKAMNEYVEAKEQEVKELTENYKIMIDGARKEARAYKDFMVEVCKEINNVNVQKKVDEFIEENKESVYEDVSSIVESAREEARSEYKQELDDLRLDMSSIKDFIKEQKKEAVNITKDTVEEVINENDITRV